MRITPFEKHFWNFSACCGGTGFCGLSWMYGKRRYDAVAAQSHDEAPAESKWGAHTYWAELGMVLPHSFDRVQFHIDFLAWTQLREHDVGIRRGRRLVRKDLELFADRLPGEMPRENLVVDIWVLAVRAARACDLKLEHHCIAIGWLFVGSWLRE